MEEYDGWFPDGFWMVSEEHPTVASIQILVTKIWKLVTAHQAHQGFVATEIIVVLGTVQEQFFPMVGCKQAMCRTLHHLWKADAKIPQEIQKHGNGS